MAAEFGWLPFITGVFIYGSEPRCRWGFSAEQFDHQTQLEFSALSNVRILHLTNFNLDSFIPTIKQYLGSSHQQSNLSP